MTLINEDLENKPSKQLMKMINTQNVTFYLKLASIFNLARIARALLSYIERCFTMVVKSKTFLQIDYDLVKRILSSSRLEITSELEVFDAADEWIRHSQEERNIHAKDLLLTVRLPLLSEKALQFALRKNSTFRENDLCLTAINDILSEKDSFFQSKPQPHHTNRCCDQREFDFLFTYGFLWVEHSDNKLDTSLKRIGGADLNNVSLLTTLPENPHCSIAVHVNGEVYFFWCCDEKGNGESGSVFKYSMVANTFEKVGRLTDARTMHCCCAFMGRVYIIGGHNERDERGDSCNVTNSCWALDPKESKREEIADMRFERVAPACAVFNGKVTVAGGLNANYEELKTVEAYDHVADEWSRMADMVAPMEGHGLVAVKNKLYALGETELQAYDKTSGRFAVLKAPFFRTNEAFSLGGKLVAVSCDEKAAFWYDAERDKWLKETCGVTSGFDSFCFVKVPRF